MNEFSLKNFEFDNEKTAQIRVELADFTGCKDVVKWNFKIDSKPAKRLKYQFEPSAKAGYFGLNLQADEKVKLFYGFDAGNYKQLRGFKENYEQNIDVFGLTSGNHMLKLKVVDSAGYETITAKNFTVKAIKIAIRFSGRLSEEKYITTPNPTLIFTIKSEGAIDNDSIIVLFDGNKFPGAMKLCNNRIYLAPFESFAIGEHKIEIFVKDDKGNKLSPYVFEFARQK